MHRSEHQNPNPNPNPNPTTKTSKYKPTSKCPPIPAISAQSESITLLTIESVTIGQLRPSSGHPHLRCPRCESNNTKFCYYNNYSLSQPRYYCKGCRRYWTKGGALRNVPVGGTTRKKSRRARSSSSSIASTTNSSSSPLSTSVSIPVTLSANNLDSCSTTVKTTTHVLKEFFLNENLPGPTESGSLDESMGLGGYMPPGFGFGFCDMGLGYGGRGVWPYQGMSLAGGGNGEAWLVGSPGYNNTWQQLGNVEQIGGDYPLDNVRMDCFGWPGITISPP
ncbi:hypothetical protein K2173_026728 [Erythroxylum novogranatense]|uniref:Dof zinc finger protein n=1 Tax=Erythroxylum novogranatense TaxID=1862640 RepID=A0AAV8TX11_9ROSI|nr:hypothetical protein K2173_026728 [Erythroxylum novogranatense]